MNHRYFVQDNPDLSDPSQFDADWSVGQLLTKKVCLHLTLKKTKTFFAKKLSKQTNSSA